MLDKVVHSYEYEIAKKSGTYMAIMEVIIIEFDNTLKARVPAELYYQRSYPPKWVATADVKVTILPPNYIGSGRDAASAIVSTALDRSSPVEFVQYTGRGALTLERGPRKTVNKHIADWINRHDPSELPSGLK
jgi:hypothetical protein